MGMRTTDINNVSFKGLVIL